VNGPRELPDEPGLNTPLGKPLPRDDGKDEKEKLRPVPGKPHLREDPQGRWSTDVPHP